MGGLEFGVVNPDGTKMKLETHLHFGKYFSKFNHIINIYIQMVQA